MVFHGKWYDEVNVGESFGTSVTVTETHIVRARRGIPDALKSSIPTVIPIRKSSRRPPPLDRLRSAPTKPRTTNSIKHLVLL
jgi:hypothetical protein